MTLLAKRVSRYGGEVLLPILDVWKFRHGRSQSFFLIQETRKAETAVIRFGAGLINPAVKVGRHAFDERFAKLLMDKALCVGFARHGFEPGVMRDDDDSAESGVEAAGRTPKAKLEPIAAMRAEFNEEDVLTGFDGFQLCCAKDVFIGLNVDAEDVGNGMVAGENTKAENLCRFLDRVVAVILDSQRRCVDDGRRRCG